MFGRMVTKFLVGGVAAVCGIYLAIASVNRIFARKKVKTEARAEAKEEAREEMKATGTDGAPAPKPQPKPAKKDYVEPRTKRHMREVASMGEGLKVVTTDVEIIDGGVSWRVPNAARVVEVENGIPKNDRKDMPKYSPDVFRITDPTVPQDDDPIGEAVLRFLTERILSQFDGFTIYPGEVMKLVQNTARGFVPGTEEFYNAFGEELTGIIPQGVLVPKCEPLMLPAQEGALVRKYGWHQNEPLELVFYMGWGPYREQIERVKASDLMVYPSRPIELPANWEYRIEKLLNKISQHADGYLIDADNDDTFTLLTTIMATRNHAWGYGGMVGEEKSMALFKYAVYRLRKILYTTFSDQAEQGEIEDAANALEEFLNLITVPNPSHKDWMVHTPMRRILKDPSLADHPGYGYYADHY